MYDCERRPYSFPLPLLLLMLLSPPPQKPCQCPLFVQVDLIVAFDAADSPIRAVQRLVRARLSHVGGDGWVQGRTGRSRSGRCVLLLTDGQVTLAFRHIASMSTCLLAYECMLVELFLTSMDRVFVL